MLRKYIPLIFAMLIVVAAVPSPTTAATIWADNPSAWAQQDVDQAITLSLVPEEMQSSYNKPITRIEFCRLSIKLLEVLSQKSILDILEEKHITIARDRFTDTSDAVVLAAESIGIVSGTGKGLFSPDSHITRAEATAMLIRTVKFFNSGHNAYYLPHLYEDGQQIPPWSRETIYEAYDLGLMRGNSANEFEPAAKLNREMAIATIARAYSITNEELNPDPFLYPMSRTSEDGAVTWGYVDKTGRFIIEPIYSYASDWNGKYGIVSEHEASVYNLVDITGRALLSFGSRYSAPYFIGNMICSNDLEEYVRELRSIPDGKILWSAYTNVSPMLNGVARILLTHVRDIYFVDRNGRVLLETGGTSGLFYDDRCIVLDGNGGGVSVSDKKGRHISDIYFFEDYEYNVEIPAAFGDKVIVSNVEETKYGVVRLPSTVIAPVEYSDVELLPSGQILCKKTVDESWSLLDERGKSIYSLPKTFVFESRIMKPNFPYAYSFDKGLIYDGIGHYVFRSTQDVLMVIDTNGKDIGSINGMTDSTVFKFSNGLIKIQEEGSVRYYNVDGNAAIE